MSPETQRRIDVRIREVVDAMPPLTSDQCRRLAVLLAPPENRPVVVIPETTLTQVLEQI